MKYRRQIIAISVLVLFCCSCSSEQGKGTQGGSNATSPQPTQKAEAKLPESPGVYYQSAGETKNLFEKPIVSSENPSFIIYLDKQVPTEKLRFRFSKYPNSRELFLLNEDQPAGVFEAKITPMENQDRMFRATYSGKLEAGEYIAYYLTDESKGKKAWAEAQFKLGGLFPVK